ncbi:hypothetical protein ANOM_008927 [Aspergillus nomiae NRRL 13137]|uniref:Uncharacterized protein n=1 Tax=Aspergillus nomiae NRRL (strain ATCC 15546 / NRRL 13137 / CBS 260.88 / M93) TaxID=1509407 RepID=A0A0L1ITM4_ASPN3|nr:uncharacterized protein ANOM_008927 [Aspergillus nomiae NRRL 13137]KNG82839.1 hypothetical protein ANOM_008927 [Aspergillus nomiae NRRL 13137]
MRRKFQKSLTQLTVFGCILFLILYLNRAPSSSPIKKNPQTYPWTRVTYQTNSEVLPPARGLCPGLKESSKPALVISRVEADGDPSWLDALSKKYHLCVYTVDAPEDPKSKSLRVPANRGHEAMTYLTFIIDNYDQIPTRGAVFAHGSRFAWHNDHPDYDNADLLAALNIPSALEPWGYHNLRCDWSLSTCPPHVAPQGGFDNAFKAVFQPWSARTISDVALPKALDALFGTGAGSKAKLGRTHTVRSQCCAQFVVARANIRRHAREEYVALRQWLLDAGTRRNAAPLDDRTSGRVLSYIWHILFIEQNPASEVSEGVDLEALNHQACPSAKDCYCRLYGRCELEKCKTPGSCFGQYRLPKDLKLPDDWAATH